MNKMYETGYFPLTVFTDGSCVDGYGGWCCIVLEAQTRRIVAEWYGYDTGVTNNLMELHAIQVAIERTAGDILIRTDSDLCIGWIARGWKRNVPHIDNKVRHILSLMDGRTVKFSHVKGHGSNPFNKRADEIALAQARRARDVNDGNEYTITDVSLELE